MDSRYDGPLELLEVIDALIDGERVDAAALKAALADPAGRDYLVDAWLVREAAQSDVAVDAPMAVPTLAPPRATLVARSRPWLVAAAFAGAIVGGFAIGYGTADRADRSPAGVPGIAGTGPAVAVTAPAPAGAFPVPPPTRVIQLDFHAVPAASGGE